MGPAVTDQQCLSERLIAPELVSQAGSDDAGEHAHREAAAAHTARI